MFRLIKLLLGIAGFAFFVWFGANIPLGSRTLFEHLQAIGRTRESQELLDGTRESAKPLVEGVRRRLSGASSRNEPSETVKGVIDGGVPPAEEISQADRERLRKILNTGHASR